MAENEKKIIEAMATAIAKMPADKRQYFLGFAEGVAAVAGADRTQPAEGAA